MTAINLAVMPDAVHFFTDAGFWREDGALDAVGNKVLLLPRFNAALAYTGRVEAAAAIVAGVERSAARGIGELTEAFPEIVERAHRATGIADNFSAIVGGWQAVPVAIAVEPIGVRTFHAGQAAMSIASELPFDPDDMVASGLAILEDQRHGEHERDGVTGHWAAGFAQHTRIDRNGIAVRVLRQWHEDRLDERVLDHG